MGRPLRFRLPGFPQLITQRGHNRLPCFMDGADYSEFVDILKGSAEASQCRVHALLMLPQAYWVLASPESGEGVSRMIQRTGRCYVRYCNTKYRREGTLWASRYHACLIDPNPNSLGQCITFLRQTPAKEAIVAPESDWPWLVLEEPTPAQAELSDTEYKQITTVLHQGLVWGSDAFKNRISKETGVRAEPGKRGRPRGNPTGPTGAGPADRITMEPR